MLGYELVLICWSPRRLYGWYRLVKVQRFWRISVWALFKRKRMDFRGPRNTFLLTALLFLCWYDESPNQRWPRQACDQKMWLLAHSPSWSKKSFRRLGTFCIGSGRTRRAPSASCLCRTSKSSYRTCMSAGRLFLLLRNLWKADAKDPMMMRTSQKIELVHLILSTVGSLFFRWLASQYRWADLCDS